MTACPRLSQTAYVVLGLVSIRPAAGHELAGFAQRSVGQIFPLTRSHIYTELAHLRQLGLLSATEVVQERFPTKLLYEVTDDGDDVLRKWLEEAPVGHDRQRNLFLVRIFFGDRMSAGRLEELLDDYETAARARRDHLSEIVERLADRPQAAYRRAAAMFGVRREQAALDWVIDARPLLVEAVTANLAAPEPQC
jgi:DNA-binding PadR family transcriptional regulator